MRDHVDLILVALVVVGLAGTYLTYTAHVDPGTTVESRTVSSWESTGEFAHGATVTEDTAAFERGTTLENRSAYLRRVAPTLNGSFAYGYTATDGGNVTAGVTTTLVLRSVARDDSSGETEYWRVERARDGERVRSLEPGERVRVPFSVNVSRAVAEARRIDERVGPTPGRTELFLESTVQLSGTRNGQSVDETRRYRLPIRVRSGVYRVEDPGAVTNSGSTTERVTVPASPGLLARVGGPALIALSMAAIAGLIVAGRRDLLSVSPEERERLAHERAVSEFDDWITTGTVPEAVRTGPRVEVDSLEGLVDVAIDTDARVIEDPDRREFVVLSAGVSYVYYPPDAEPDDDPLAARPLAPPQR